MENPVFWRRYIEISHSGHEQIPDPIYRGSDFQYTMPLGVYERCQITQRERETISLRPAAPPRVNLVNTHPNHWLKNVWRTTSGHQRQNI